MLFPHAEPREARLLCKVCALTCYSKHMDSSDTFFGDGVATKALFMKHLPDDCVSASVTPEGKRDETPRLWSAENKHIVLP